MDGKTLKVPMTADMIPMDVGGWNHNRECGQTGDDILYITDTQTGINQQRGMGST